MAVVVSVIAEAKYSHQAKVGCWVFLCKGRGGAGLVGCGWVGLVGWVYAEI